MIIRVENIGIIRWAEFKPSDLTIICGDNNAGKSFATYAWFGFLHFFRNEFRIPLQDNLIPDFINSGNVVLNAKKSLPEINEILDIASNKYSSKLHEVFATPVESFSDSKFHVRFEESDLNILSAYNANFHNQGGELIQVTKKGDDDDIHFLWIAPDKNERPSGSFKSLMALIFSNVLKRIFFLNSLPVPFVTSAERTGAVIFKKDIITFPLQDDPAHPEKIQFRQSRYPLPIIQNVDFINSLDIVTKRQGKLGFNHPDIFDALLEISGGEYSIDKDTGLVLFKPHGSKGRFQMAQSASSVRALMDLYFYLKHIAAPGQLLIIDEPELNLHPSRQVAMGRLICLLVRYGLKVVITTHSDYILREINNLLLLDSKRGKKAVNDILMKYKIKENCLISHDKVALFTAKKSLVSLPGYKKRQNINTLVESSFDPNLGFVDNVFNDTLQTAALLQQEITLASYED